MSPDPAEEKGNPSADLARRTSSLLLKPAIRAAIERSVDGRLLERDSQPTHLRSWLELCLSAEGQADLVAAYNKLGLSIRSAPETGPSKPVLLHRFALVCCALGLVHGSKYFSEAVECFRGALDFFKQHDVEAHANTLRTRAATRMWWQLWLWTEAEDMSDAISEQRAAAVALVEAAVVDYEEVLECGGDDSLMLTQTRQNLGRAYLRVAERSTKPLCERVAAAEKAVELYRDLDGLVRLDVELLASFPRVGTNLKEARRLLEGLTLATKPGIEESPTIEAEAGGSAVIEGTGAITDVPADIETEVTSTEEFAKASRGELLQEIARLRAEALDVVERTGDFSNAELDDLVATLEEGSNVPPAGLAERLAAIVRHRRAGMRLRGEERTLNSTDDRRMFEQKVNSLLDGYSLRFELPNGQLARLQLMTTGTIRFGVPGDNESFALDFNVVPVRRWGKVLAAVHSGYTGGAAAL